MKGQPSPIKDSADHKAIKLSKGNLTYHSAGLPIEPQMELVSVETPARHQFSVFKAPFGQGDDLGLSQVVGTRQESCRIIQPQSRK
ncbi:hypothetical protein D5270_01905 [Acutalibacter sp. 1XD8-36]|nr:hypothetical protein [Acutalibacter sp. 1XD8-36]